MTYHPRIDRVSRARLWGRDWGLSVLPRILLRWVALSESGREQLMSIIFVQSKRIEEDTVDLLLAAE